LKDHHRDLTVHSLGFDTRMKIPSTVLCVTVLILTQVAGFASDITAGKIFRTVDERSSIKVISADELELTEEVQGPRWVCKYSRDGDSLRVVTTVLGSPQALYFKIIPEGLRDTHETTFYDSDHFDAASREAKAQAEERHRQQVAAALAATPLPTAPPGTVPGKPFMTSKPHIEYPYEARRSKTTGSGVVLMAVNPSTGEVKDVSMAQSTGSQVLDNECISAFKRARFQSGVTKAKVPVSFTLTGASY
jgi:TonB family protein